MNKILEKPKFTKEIIDLMETIWNEVLWVNDSTVIVDRFYTMRIALTDIGWCVVRESRNILTVDFPLTKLIQQKAE